MTLRSTTPVRHYLDNVIGEIEVRMSHKEVAKTLKAVFSETVDGAAEISNSCGFSGQLAQPDEVGLDTVQQPGLELVQLQGVLLQFDALVLLLVVADLVVGQRVLG